MASLERLSQSRYAMCIEDGVKFNVVVVGGEGVCYGRWAHCLIYNFNLIIVWLKFSRNIDYYAFMEHEMFPPKNTIKWSFRFLNLIQGLKDRKLIYEMLPYWFLEHGKKQQGARRKPSTESLSTIFITPVESPLSWRSSHLFIPRNKFNVVDLKLNYTFPPIAAVFFSRRWLEEEKAEAATHLSHRFLPLRSNIALGIMATFPFRNILSDINKKWNTYGP